MTRITAFTGVVGTTLLAAAAATADVVSTSDGSRLVGTVEQIADGKLVIQTEFAGRMEIETSKITSISTDRPVNVAIESGDQIVGAMAPSRNGQTSVVQSELGAIEVSPASVIMLWPEGEESPEAIALREAATPKWTTTLEAFLTQTEGNTDTLEGGGRFDLQRKTSEDLLQFYLAGKYGEQDDRRTTNEYLGGIRYENSFTERWYWYARTELEYDEFEGIDLRATAAAGVGYYWIRKPEHELKTGAGLGYRHESYADGRTIDSAVFDLGLDYRVDITPWAQFTHSTVYSPAIDDFDDYRLNFDTALLIPFKDDRWAWKVGVRNDYNSRPQPGFERLDNMYYTSIVLSLK